MIKHIVGAIRGYFSINNEHARSAHHKVAHNVSTDKAEAPGNEHGGGALRQS
jgi:hypothetical protein